MYIFINRNTGNTNQVQHSLYAYSVPGTVLYSMDTKTLINKVQSLPLSSWGSQTRNPYPVIFVRQRRRILLNHHVRAGPGGYSRTGDSRIRS